MKKSFSKYNYLKATRQGFFYTDGSQKDACASAGLCQIRNNTGFPLLKNWNLRGGMEVIDAEVFAIAKALCIMAKNPPKDLKPAYIFVDSQAAIARLQNNIGNQVTQRAFKAGEILQQYGVKIQIQWCPSHTGIPGNEMADHLAKRGLEKENISKQAYISLSHLKKKENQQTQKRW